MFNARYLVPEVTRNAPVYSSTLATVAVSPGLMVFRATESPVSSGLPWLIIPLTLMGTLKGFLKIRLAA